MKNSILIVGFLGLFALTSCTKNYVCSCNIQVTSGGVTVEQPKQNYSLSDMKKQEAIDSCNAKDMFITEGNTTTTTNCEIN